MLEYTIDNDAELKEAYDKGVKAAKAKHKRWGHTRNSFHVSDNPYKRSGSFGKKLKAAWHNGFKAERAGAI